MIEEEYIKKIGLHLELFKKVRDGVWNSRCPICGDSKKKRTKKRFYILSDNDSYFVKCHNCGYVNNFGRFMKENFPQYYDEYVLSKLGRKNKKLRKFSSSDLKKISEPVISKGFDYSSLKTFNDLATEHPARKYLEKRNLPLDQFYYAPSFIKFIETIGIKEYMESFRYNTEPRIIIPFYKTSGKSSVFQARSFVSDDPLRYITIKENSSEKKIYGLERINPDKQVYCTEGPFDSHMIDNCIAMSGASIKIPSYLGKLVFIYDNEPRNYDIVNFMRKKLTSGHGVVIFPKIVKWKDLNDMVVKGGYTKDKLKELIDDNTWYGLKGIARLMEWRKS